MKSHLPALQRLTTAQHLLNCLAEVRFSAQKERALIRLPKTLALLAAVLLAVFAIGAGTGAAQAHGNDSHQVFSNSSALEGWIAEISPDSSPQIAWDQVLSASDEAPQGAMHHGLSQCCCGSGMCYAGAALAVDFLSFPLPTRAQVMAGASSGGPQGSSYGLERPPRSLDMA
ncbi:MAG: hypothetical protein K2X43_08170 [Hyphomonadaceae bacterium]|nr:hypothetical protein [Hyphomonadaceae bacterium]